MNAITLTYCPELNIYRIVLPDGREGTAEQAQIDRMATREPMWADFAQMAKSNPNNPVNSK